MATIGSLVAELSLETASFHKDMGKALATLSSSSASMNKMFANIKSASGDLFKMLGVGFSAAGLILWTKNLIDAGAELEKMSQKTGIAVEKLSAYAYAGKLADVSTQDINTALKKLGESMQDSVINPGGEAAKMFRAIGLSAAETNPALTTTDAVFEKLSAAFAGAADGPEKVTVAIRLLGRSGQDLIPMMNTLKTSMEEAKRTGNIIPESFAIKAQEFNDTITKINASMQSFVANNKSTTTFFDAIQTLMKGTVTVGLNLINIFEDTGRTIAAVSASILALVKGNTAEASKIMELYRQDNIESYNNLAKAQKKVWEDLPVQVKKGVDGASKELPRLKLNFDTQLDVLAESWKNTTKQMDTASVGWANRSADALTEFVMTGKFKFKEFAQSIIADLVRIRIQQQLAGIFLGLKGVPLGGLGSTVGGSAGAGAGAALGGAFASGGDPPIGRPSLVGEKGPELFTPRQAGTITPIDQLGGGVNVTNIFNISPGVPETVRAEVMSMLPQITEHAKAGVQSAIERGGPLSRSVGRRR